MALQKRGQVWSSSNLVKKIFSMQNSNDVQLFDHVDHG